LSEVDDLKDLIGKITGSVEFKTLESGNIIESLKGGNSNSSAGVDLKDSIKADLAKHVA
jgi:hypothetical protein